MFFLCFPKMLDGFKRYSRVNYRSLLIAGVAETAVDGRNFRNPLLPLPMLQIENIV